MPRTGSGVYVLPTGNPVVPGTVIRSVWANTTMSDIATALTNSLAKDGQTVPTANLPMGGFKFTNVGPATAANEYLTAGQEQDGSFHVVTSVAETAPNTYTGNLIFGDTTFVFGQVVLVQFPTANLGPVTLNINGGGPKAVVDDGGNPLTGGDIIIGAIFVLCWDGTAWRVINSPGTGSGTFLPVAGGQMTGRIGLAGDTPYDLITGAVNTALYATGTFTVPASKNSRILFWDSTYTLSGNALVTGFNFQPTVHTTNAGDTAYGVIGAIHIDGPGSLKSIYGRAASDAGHTGVVVGIVGAVTIAPTATPSTAWCAQLEYAGHASAFCWAEPTVSGDQIDGGFIIGSKTKMMTGAAFQYNKFTGGGANAAFARMYGGGGALLYEVDQNALVFGKAMVGMTGNYAPGATYTADYAVTGQNYNINMSANLVVTLANVPAGAVMRFFLQSTTGKTITFTGLAGLFWPNGIPPTIDAGPGKACCITLWQPATGIYAAAYTTY